MSNNLEPFSELSPNQQKIIAAALRMNYQLDPERLLKLIKEGQQKQQQLDERRGIK